MVKGQERSKMRVGSLIRERLYKQGVHQQWETLRIVLRNI